MRTYNEFRQDAFDLKPHPAYERHEPVSTFALITAHNPMGVRKSDRENYDANGRLLADIKSLGCHATMVRGMYSGHREETFCVANITEPDVLRLCIRHRQEAAIWAYLRSGPSGYQFVVYYLDNLEPVAQKQMEVEQADVATKEAFFSALKSGKIKIPEFTPKKNAVAVLSNDKDIDPLPFGDA